MIKFGSAGNPDDFYNSGYKVSEQMPFYLSKLGLNAYEYQCSRGVRISEQKALLLKSESEKHTISLSVHAPYYISLSTQEEEKKKKTIQYILDTAKIASVMGADRIVVHAGALLGLERSYAVASSCSLLKKALQILDENHLGHIHICPETMGKINQLGNTKEIIQMCLIDSRLIPTIDFGHLYCRSLGKLRTKEEWKKELSLYISSLGYDRMKYFHSHFSKMLYSNGGEKCHVTFANLEAGPNFSIISQVLQELQLEPTIICESAGTQAIDAVQMKEIYETTYKENS